MEFSIGYNQDNKLLGLLDIYKDNIEALYLPIPEHYLGTGRYIPQSRDYTNQIPRIITKCNSLNITPPLLLNATYEGKFGLTKIIPKLPDTERYDLKDQLSRSCKAIPRLIAEGYAKKHQRQGFQKYLDDAMGECNEVDRYI